MRVHLDRLGQSIVIGAAWWAALVPWACSADGPAAGHGDKTTVKQIRPLPPGAKEFVDAREEMVTRQIQHPRDGRAPVRDQRVCAAMRAVPRHEFVPDHIRSRAYVDSPLPIGHDQTISQPYIVALMTELLEVTEDSKILEIGTGSGYQAAVLAHLTPHVYTMEIVKPLAERAARILREQGYDQVECRCGDGYLGWPEHAPFDGIIVTCAPDHLPPALWEQLKPGGRVVIPIGGQHEVQRLEVITKTEDGQRRSRTIIPVRFVPLTRDKNGEADDKTSSGDRP